VDEGSHVGVITDSAGGERGFPYLGGHDEACPSIPISS
jgi:hypothetical protein